MNDAVVTEIVDLNKKPEPKPAPNPNEWTPEQIEEAKLVNVEPITTQEPLTMEQLEEKTRMEQEITELMLSQPEIDPRKTIKTSTVADAYFTVDDSILLKNLFESIHKLVDEVVFQFEPDMLVVRLMDPSRVAMLDYMINKQYFQEWEVKKPGYAVFNIEEVLKVVFAKIKKETVVKFSVDHQTDKLVLTLKDSRTRTREFFLLNTDEVPETPPKPKINFNALFKVVAKQWQEDIKDMHQVTDHIEIHVAPEGVKVKAEGDVVKAENKYELGSDILLNVEVREYSRAIFSLSYFEDFVDPKLCDIATLELTTNMPIRITMHTKFGDLYSYLAPRIETD